MESLKSAQDVFSVFLRRHLAPGLRALGFKGSGQTYLLASNEYWMLLGIQRSSFSDAAGIPFTVNLTVADKRKWANVRSRHPAWPETPNANRFYGPEIWQSRIGSLLPGGTDKWWRVQPDTDVEELATELLMLIRHVAVREMTARAVPADESSVDQDTGRVVGWVSKPSSAFVMSSAAEEEPNSTPKWIWPIVKHVTAAMTAAQRTPNVSRPGGVQPRATDAAIGIVAMSTIARPNKCQLYPN